MVWHATRGAGRHRRRRPQLPQVDPARDHDDRRDPGVPDADAQPPAASSARSRSRSSRRRTSRRRSTRNPFAREREEQEAAHPDAHAEHLRRRALQRRDDQGRCSTATIDTLHFDEAWLPHAAFHDFYRDMHAIGKDRPRPKDALIFATQSTHKLLAGICRRRRRSSCRTRETRKLDRHLFNEAYLMHTSTSPQYAIIASCDVAGGDDGAARRHRAGRGDRSSRRSTSAARCARSTTSTARTGGSRSGVPRRSPRRASATATTGCSRAERQVARLRQPRAGLQHARPDQGDVSRRAST